MKQIRTSHRLRRIATGALAILGATVAIPSLHADPPPPHGVVAAQIGVLQLGNGNAAADVVVTNELAVGDFRVRPTANRGDFDVQIGDDLADDVQGGILVTSISEHFRDQGESSQLIGTAPNQVPAYLAGPHVATSHFESQAGGSYFIPIAYVLPNSVATTVVEFNMNVGAAWFPYDKYLGMYVWNNLGRASEANGQVNDTKMAGSPGLTVGTHFIDPNVAPLGRATVNLTSLGINGNTDGVLLVVGAKNEDNYALSQVNTDGTWTLYSKDNGTDAATLERDPLAFVYIPRTNQFLTSGRFAGDASILITSTNKVTADFTVAHIDIGRWELKVTGGGPDKGVLVISPEGGLNLNRDNIVTYQANEARDGWIIESRDLTLPFSGTTVTADLPPLEDVGTEPVTSFVYIPGSTPGFVVAPTNNLFTSESGTTATFTVQLETRPKADVTIDLASSNTAEGTVSPSSITFTTNDWNVAQSITVTGVDDSATDGSQTFNIVLAPATSTDAEYNGLNPADVTIVNIDNEGGITVNPTGGLFTTEIGDTATFTIRLTQAPTADVTIGLSSSDLTEGTVFPASVVFTTANWDQEQIVTIAGADDFVDDGNVGYSIITAAATSADPFFNNRASADVAVINNDNDTAGVTVTPAIGLAVVESGGTAAYTIVLNSEPTADVTISTTTSDPTEGSVSPVSFTFNAGNWSSPQEFMVTGVDDLVVDGNIRFFVTNSLTSTDPLYAPIVPLSVTVTNLDDEAVLSLPTSVVNWGIGSPAIGIAGRATIFDPNTADYANGNLRVTVAGGNADDRIEIRNNAQVSVAGNIVSFEGTPIGSTAAVQDGLQINLNAAATPVATEALLRAITFRNVAATPAEGSRTVTVTLTDAGGAVVSATTTIRISLLRVTEFQEGADLGYGVYTGAADTELNQVNPDVAYPVGRNASGLLMDWPDDNLDPPNFNSGQALLRFDNLVGTGPNQIPTNSIIVSAELYFDINDTGDGSPLYRMLVPWDAETATWNTFFIEGVGGGVVPDDVRARSTFDSQIGVANGSGATTVGTVWIGVTPDVNAWVNGGETNFGWVMPGWPNNRDGTFFSPSEAANVTDRPRLRVSWLPKDSATLASFQQGVNDYFGVEDTRIRQTTPDTDFSTTTSVFSDAIVTGTDPNPEHVLVRFKDIIGSLPGQIPAGSKVYAAVLDIASIVGDAMGDGGQIFALLQGWPEPPITWNTWVDGIQTNGVEAAATPSALAGSPTLDPDVQGAYLSFNLTSDVQAWVSGTSTNAGWAIIPWPGGGNGWGFATSEAANERDRPRLRVYYTGGTVQPVEIRLGQPVRTATSLELTFTGETSTAYEIYRSATVDGTYSKVGDASTGANGQGTFTDNAPPATSAFYQVRKP